PSFPTRRSADLALAVLVVILGEARIVDVHLTDAGELLRRRLLAAPGVGDPLEVTAGDLLHLLARRGLPGLVRLGVVGRDGLLPALELALLVLRQRAPPAVAALVGLLAPPLDDFVLVLRVVEAVERFVCHDRLPFL